MKDMMQTPYFRIVVVDDEETVELCGALKVINATLCTDFPAGNILDSDILKVLESKLNAVLIRKYKQPRKIFV